MSSTDYECGCVRNLGSWNLCLEHEIELEKEVIEVRPIRPSSFGNEKQFMKKYDL